MLQMSQGVLGSAMLIAGLAVVYVFAPTAEQPEKIGDTAAPFVSVLCTGLIFGGAMLVFAAVVF